MIKLTSGPQASIRIPLTPNEEQVLGHLYLYDGAWTQAEAISHLGEAQFRVFNVNGILGRQDTDMGPMYHLLARGRIAVYGASDGSMSLQSQLDRAYVRLSLRQLGWEVLPGDSPFFKGYASLFPHVRFTEVSSSMGRVLVAGKITGGGYSAEGIKRIAQMVRSSALNKSFSVVILTPHPRRGGAAAKRNENVIQVVEVCPGGRRSRFDFMPVATKLPDQGPSLSGPSIEQLRRAQARPDVTLSILAMTRLERIKQAQLALDVDRALSATQLQRYYGINPVDLQGRLSTSAIVRPVKGRSVVEIQQRIVVADARVARLGDGDLVHRLTTAQVRLNLGIPADSERWIVESRGNLQVEEPDAIHIDPSGSQHAIEADIGHYSLTTILRKLESFHDQGYQETVWGTPSNTRISNLTRKIERNRQPRFVWAQWWP